MNQEVDVARLFKLIGIKEYEMDILREHISRLEKEKKELQEKYDKKKKETKPLKQEPVE